MGSLKAVGIQTIVYRCPLDLNESIIIIFLKWEVLTKLKIFSSLSFQWVKVICVNKIIFIYSPPANLDNITSIVSLVLF